MTATERLRAMLDERGVEHYDGTETTLWGYEPTGNGTGIYRYAADEISDGFLNVRMHRLTPEQAIEATLGRGECRNRARRPQTFWCDQCDCATEAYVDVGGTLITGFRYCPWCGRKVRA